MLAQMMNKGRKHLNVLNAALWHSFSRKVAILAFLRWVAVVIQNVGSYSTE
jgi:hypothetical protein